MDVASDDLVTTGTETRETMDHVPASPSLWRAVVHAFRHAQLQRLQARVNRLRRRMHIAPTVHEQRMLLVAAESHQTTDAGWPSVPTTRHRRPWLFTAVACLMILAGIALGALFLRSRADVGRTILFPTSEPHVRTISQEMMELRTLLTSLEERVTLLHHQVLQQGDQLTNQAATVLSVNQHADTQHTQITALAEALTVLTSQVAHLEQQVTTQATHLITQEQHRVTQTMPSEHVQPPTQNEGRHGAHSTGRTHRPRPPTLELFAPPVAPTTTPVPYMPPSPVAVGTPLSRRTITLPAALGVEGYRGATVATEGTQP